jgi:nickel/cobalt exporter
MELGLLLIFWYGILHAFGPDHLTAIADFSIGKSKKKTLLITFLFAMGHGIILFIFAKILQYIVISDELLGYGDLISSSIILFMGIYLFYMAITNKIFLNKHNHNGKEHIHISFNKQHKHTDKKDTVSAFTIGALMGIGGVRGMLITLGVIESNNVDFTLVFMFALGVLVVFVVFGYVINYINENFLTTRKNIKNIFLTTGIISIAVATNILLG